MPPMSKFTLWAEQYIQDQQRLLAEINVEAINKVLATLRFDIYSKVFICGNGGSLSNSQHFMCDLIKGANDSIRKDKKGKLGPFRGLALGTNPSLSSAISNDYSYEDIFVRELQAVAKPLDILIGLSVSGNSMNVVKAFKFAKNYNIRTVAIVGNKGKNKLEKMADYTIAMDSGHFGRVEDVTMTILHMICYYFIEGVYRLQQ